MLRYGWLIMILVKIKETAMKSMKNKYSKAYILCRYTHVYYFIMK